MIEKSILNNLNFQNTIKTKKIRLLIISQLTDLKTN